MNNLLVRNLVRNDYKIQKAWNILMEADKSPKIHYTPEYALSEMKMVKQRFGSKLFTKYLKDAGVLKSIKFNRNKYGQDGVTETVKHIIKSKPYFKFFLFERGLFCGNYNMKKLADLYNALTYDTNNLMKFMKKEIKKDFIWEK